jgi:hypothetical protein
VIVEVDVDDDPEEARDLRHDAAALPTQSREAIAPDGKHPGPPPRRVTVRMHSGDLKTGTLRSILREAGLTVEEFVAML